MAGDWIQMRCDLAEDPAVIAIAAKVKLDEFAVVGRLHALWSWADRQSRDGHAVGVTHSFIDRKVQCDGFAAAMVEAEWLKVDLAGVTFPNFDRYMGKSAKNRALSARRQQTHRSAVTPEVTASSRSQSRIERDNSVTREEKRREEKEGRAISCQQVIDLFNQTMVGIPKVRGVTESRKKLIQKACEADAQRSSHDWWKAYFEECAADNFLNGTGPYRNGHEGWTPTFDYLLRLDVLTKNYEAAMHKLEQGAH